MISLCDYCIDTKNISQSIFQIKSLQCLSKNYLNIDEITMRWLLNGDTPALWPRNSHYTTFPTSVTFSESFLKALPKW